MIRFYKNSLRADRFGDFIPVENTLSTPDQTGLKTHPASYRMGTVFLAG